LTSEGWPTSNLPLRGGKGWMYEGGIRVPLLVRWPSTIKPGRVVNIPVSSPDIFPTLLEVAKASRKPDQPLDGLSLVPVFEDLTFPDRPLFWHYPHYGNQGGAPAAAVRRGRWKWIKTFENERAELFDLATDPSEQTNLIDSESAHAASLEKELVDWLKDVGAEMPVPNPKFDSSKPSGRFATRPKSNSKP